MKISFANALGLHPQALQLRARRTEVLASNLANSDTPHYKARDFDVDRLLRGPDAPKLPLQKTSPDHLSLDDEDARFRLLYRVPQQAALDGNTVEEHIEQAKFAENALRYQASLRFVNGKFSGLMTAIRGE
ncbi:flagellar basal-body rod protein FlgB [Methylomarinovum tepidoasis]|uniref:Flagellar basal body rod protein FlgB n=1 Tax=Methylomarinovum tepidoasis TaxID=2840183 RepID=A0AAU9C873_9GAMM|nr:flagellar basal body rod protein FlgB [Methylomarinovum sp. IN45]BCX88650.1 flagellar basal-body rod protein FlgB [Methylomarinovum sp. IN45]